MIYYDSSALVKKYVLENGSENVLRVLEQGGLAATSKLSYAEIHASLARKRRERALSEKDYHGAAGDFESDWREFLVVEFQDELLPIIRQLSARHALKGADLVHLGSALWLKKAAGEKITFLASDAQLLKLAKLEKLEIVNPERK